MFDQRAFARYLATAADAAPVGRHADGSPCYTPGCTRGGIPWKNIQKHNAMERAQMKFDFSGKNESDKHQAEASLADRLRSLSDDQLSKFMEEHQKDTSSPEFKAFLVEMRRRSNAYYDRYEAAHR